MTAANVLVIGAFGPYLAGALLAVTARGRATGALSHLLAVLGGAYGVALGVTALAASADLELVAGSVAPFARLALRLDPLSAFFLTLVSLVVVLASLYAPDYLSHGHHHPGLLGLGMNGFAASMTLVILADTVFTFMLAWELMSLISFLLVMAEHQQAENRRAGLVYLAMTHVSGAFLLASFLGLGAFAGSLDFTGLRGAGPALPASARNLVFLAALIGSGTKAGLVPLHVWLPRAHPAAPSHISALMSGAMVKLGVYAFLRVCLDLTGSAPAWWGTLVLILGTVTAVIGVLNAMIESDLKRMLAYSTVDNVGIVFIALGASMLLATTGTAATAAFALTAGLLHALNHAAFKTLLFLGAGAVLNGTGTRNLERLGGLSRQMPWTAATFLVGSAAIAGVPPLNGFAGEWMTVQSLLALATARGLPMILAAAAAAGLALTAGLSLFAFVKAYGVAFLGMPRSGLVAGAQEIGAGARSSMVLAAAICMALGLAPGILTGFISSVAERLFHSHAPSAALAGLPGADTGADYLPTIALLSLLALAAVGAILGRLIGGPSRERIAPPWVCGVPMEAGMQYTASALAKIIRIVFSRLVQAESVVQPRHALAPYLVSSIHYEAWVAPIYERLVYRRIVSGLVRTSRGLHAIQNGSLRMYLVYVFATVIVVLLVVR
ncbi:MAG: proton-conducting transporter membrane subunit [Chloroflexota bacterium]